jgi:serine/threonine-protein kinase RsbW
MNFDEQKIEDIKTAISEACTNAIRHGSGTDARTKVVVILTADEDKLDILVKDPGTGGTPPAEVTIPDINNMIAQTTPPGGMGLYIIQELMDEAEFIKGDDEHQGNQFRMVIYRMDDDPDVSQPEDSIDNTNSNQ